MIYIIKRWFKYLLIIDGGKPYYETKRQAFDRNGRYLGLKFKNNETTKIIAKQFKGRVVKL